MISPVWRQGFFLLSMCAFAVACLVVGFMFATETEDLPHLERTCSIADVTTMWSWRGGDRYGMCRFLVRVEKEDATSTDVDVAYRYVPQVFNETEGTAAECKDEKLFPRSPVPTTCYVPQNGSGDISMTPAYDEEKVPTWYLYVALTMAAVTGFGICWYLVSINRTYVNRAGAENIEEQTIITHPAPTRKAKGFSKEQVSPQLCLCDRGGSCDRSTLSPA